MIQSAALAMPAPDLEGADPSEQLRRLADHAAASAGGGSAWFILQSPTLGARPVDPEGAAGTPEQEIPVRLAGEVVGSLVLAGGAGALDEEHAAEIAQRAAPALGALVVQEMGRQVAESEAMLEVGKSLTEVLNVEELLLRVVGMAEALVLGHASAIATRQSDDTLVVRFATGTLVPLEGVPFGLEGNDLGAVVREGEGRLVAAVDTAPDGSPLDAPLGAGAVVPIRVAGEVTGALLVARIPGAPPFTEQDQRTLERMAAYTAIALQNAQAHHEQQEHAREIQRAYQELEDSQGRLFASEKLAALGRVTAGIAHEINSPLGSILSSIRCVRKLVDEYRSSAGHVEVTVEDHHEIAGDMARALDLAQVAADRLGQFVRSIKAQTRAGDNPNARFDVAQEIDNVVVLLNHSLRQGGISVFTEMERGHLLRGDPGQLGMVVQNLITNAADAYEGRPGELWVRLKAEGKDLLLEVEDQGSGIPEEIRSRVFDHLFTTKDVGKGTGLGLSMVHSVVTSLGGTVTFDSTVGVGTTFHLRFPLLQGEE